MARINQPEEIERNYVEDSYTRAYLTGTQSLNWTIGTIKATSLKDEELRTLLDGDDSFVQIDELKRKRSKD